MAKTPKQLQPHKFSDGDTVKVVRSGKTEWCKIGDTHTIRICKHDHEDGPVYVVDDDKDDAWIRECNLELVERDRQKGGEWKRHRGGKQPVANDTQVECRMRNGDIEKFNASGFMWDHNGQDDDIMAYRVISQPQAEEVEVITAEEKKVVNDRQSHACQAKTDQIDGPIKWRDTILHCQAIIEDCEREIQRNVDLLDAEGLMMLADNKKAMQYYAPDVIPFAEWKVGDIVEVISVDVFCDPGLRVGDQMPITHIDKSDDAVQVASGAWGNEENYKFIRSA